jgi:hypothetical protein
VGVVGHTGRGRPYAWWRNGPPRAQARVHDRQPALRRPRHR